MSECSSAAIVRIIRRRPIAAPIACESPIRPQASAARRRRIGSPEAKVFISSVAAAESRHKLTELSAALRTIGSLSVNRSRTAFLAFGSSIRVSVQTMFRRTSDEASANSVRVKASTAAATALCQLPHRAIADRRPLVAEQFHQVADGETSTT